MKILALAIVGIGLVMSCDLAAAQPTAAQQSAIRSACSGDYQSYCAGVPTGGSAALACLEKAHGPSGDSEWSRYIDKDEMIECGLQPSTATASQDVEAFCASLRNHEDGDVVSWERDTLGNDTIMDMAKCRSFFAKLTPPARESFRQCLGDTQHQMYWYYRRATVTKCAEQRWWME